MSGDAGRGRKAGRDWLPGGGGELLFVVPALLGKWEGLLCPDIAHSAPIKSGPKALPHFEPRDLPFRPSDPAIRPCRLSFSPGPGITGDGFKFWCLLREHGPD